MFDGKAFIITLPAIIKAKTDGSGRRLVEVEVSNESTDSEGDIILQKALLDSADEFIQSGHLDINHYSELGHRVGISNPSSWIVGRPTEVKDYGKGCTGVVGEIRKSADGISDPVKNRYDEFWESLQTDPPVKWSASIFGYPKAGMFHDCRTEKCEPQAARYLVKGINWRSTAFTTSPINQSLTKFAHIVTAKAFMGMLKGPSGAPLNPVTTVGLSGGPLDSAPPQFPDENAGVSFPGVTMPPGGGPSGNLAAGELAPEFTEPGETAPPPPGRMYLPHNMDSLVGQYHNHLRRGLCPANGGVNSVLGFKAHFVQCCGAPENMAEMLSHALMYYVLLEKKRDRAA